MRLAAAALAAALALGAGTARAELYYLIVTGLGGEPGYAEEFADNTAAMVAAAERTLGETTQIRVLSGDGATLEALRAALDELSQRTEASDRLAVFLVGHGSHDGVDYKFNLTGPDVTGSELAERLDAMPARSQLVVNASSASGAVLEQWAADGRVVITATRNGRERNATTFAAHWAAALSAGDADINKNGSISVQEAFDYASRLVAESYEAEGTLATEHPEIRGDATSAFEISRLTARADLTPEIEALDRELADLEEQVASLRLRRDELDPDAYQTQMLDLQVEIALLQEQIDEAMAEQ